MASVSVQYRVRQHFPYSANRAFAWCVDYDSGDLRLEGFDGKRSVQRITDDTLILRDTFSPKAGTRVRKVKLVRIRPSERSWTATHLVGRTRRSQFWYRIVADGPRSSHLEYVGLQVEPAPARGGSAALAARLTREDAAAWKNLARAMKRDLG